MQDELQSQYPLLKIMIGGINQSGNESANASIVAGRDLIFMQDADANQNGNGEVWDAWQAEWRDVFVLDGSNNSVQKYNLTTHNLATASYYSELRGMLVDAAMRTQKPYTFESRPVDVDGNGILAPRDALLVINRLNQGGSGALEPPTGNSIPAYVDVDGNLNVAPIDALTVINALNQRPGGEAGEGEANNRMDLAVPAAKKRDSEMMAIDAPLDEMPSGGTPAQTKGLIDQTPMEHRRQLPDPVLLPDLADLAELAELDSNQPRKTMVRTQDHDQRIDRALLELLSVFDFDARCSRPLSPVFPG